ncbi:MAG TPA: kinase inhibitor [Gemmatimonadaceae bacterium]|nr:kinase inhibitor [Gemmatimonadaceae bacterium]
MFTLTSSDIQDGKTIPMKHVFKGMSCTGENVSPALSWSGAPAGTKSFAVTCHDPDAPTGSGWWHWVVYNIPASATGLAQGAGDASGQHLPKGAAQGKTDFGTAGYGGPCPPPGHGVHHYHFKVHALDVDHLDIPDGGSPAMVGFNLHFHSLASAEIVALFERK